MANLEWHSVTVEGITLVHLVVTAETTERVRVENRIDGSLWPPRRQGSLDPGWDDEGFTGTVDADDRLSLGYATPGKAIEPPATIVETEAVGGDERPSSIDARRRVGPSERESGDMASAPWAAPPSDEDSSRRHRERNSPRKTTPAETASSEPPGDVGEWLDTVADRLDTAERLDQASSVREASAAVEAAGGHGALRDLRRTLAEDRAAIDAVSDRTERLQARLDTVDIPVETLGYLQ